MKKINIGFIGNFIPSFSTENERKKAFEELGHTVICFQENQTKSIDLLEAMPNLDMLIYSHTHDPSYVIKDLKKVFAIFKANNIPTMSAHLDRWLWLNREKDMGHEATWFTEYIFMADCSPEAIEKYDELGLNWHYLPPAVAKDQCYITEPDYNRFPHKIIFTGSKGYHPEYPYRSQMIDFLARTYGDKFGHYGNDGIRVVREKDLNVLYASSKIVIGDSCFGGRINYISDRLTEVTGRGGFIITPSIETLKIPSIATYDHPNLQDLKEKIDYYLINQEEREKTKEEVYQYVKKNHTYTNRAEQIINVVFKNQ